MLINYIAGLLLLLFRNLLGAVASNDCLKAATIATVLAFDGLRHSGENCDLTSTKSCSVAFTPAPGKVTLEFDCTDNCAPTATKLCYKQKACNEKDKDLVKNIVGNFTKCVQYDGATASFTGTSALPEIFCTGNDAEKQCQRLLYDNSGSKTWIGCGADCSTTGKTALTGSESAFACQTCTPSADKKNCVVVPRNCIDLSASSGPIYLKTQMPTATCNAYKKPLAEQKCFASYTITGGQGKVSWKFGCGDCVGPNCVSCSTHECNKDLSKIADKNVLTKCPLYENQDKKTSGFNYDTVYCAGDYKNCMRADLPNGKVWIGCGRDCANAIKDKAGAECQVCHWAADDADCVVAPAAKTTPKTSPECPTLPSSANNDAKISGDKPTNMEKKGAASNGGWSTNIAWFLVFAGMLLW